MAITKVCKKCSEEKVLEEDFYVNRAAADGRCYACKECTSIQNRAYAKRRYAGWTPEEKSAHWQRVKYGVTGEDYQTMLDAQGGGCAICGAKTSNHGRTDRFLVDHSHANGHVRGLLCHGCNGGLGHFRDNPISLQRAILYLEEKGI